MSCGKSRSSCETRGAYQQFLCKRHAFDTLSSRPFSRLPAMNTRHDIDDYIQDKMIARADCGDGVASTYLLPAASFR